MFMRYWPRMQIRGEKKTYDLGEQIVFVLRFFAEQKNSFMYILLTHHTPLDNICRGYLLLHKNNWKLYIVLQKV